MAKQKRCWMVGVAVVAAVLIAGVGAAADKAPPAKSKAKSAPVLKPGDPTAHGLREADLDALRNILQKAVDDKTVPGVALLLAHKSEIIFKEAFGDLKVDQPVKLASDSKPISATVVMVVVDQGKMRLDDPLTKFVPEFKGTKVEKATVRQLLCHGAGIGDEFSGGWPRANTLAEFAAAVATQGSLQTPGKYRYSTVGIDLACRCAEKAAGRPFEELLHERLCDPLDMKHTRFEWGGDARAVPKEARDRGEGRYVSGGGGLSATLDDMAVFYQMHLNGGSYGDKQILSRKSATEMHRIQSAVSRGASYGLGFVLFAEPTRSGVSWIIRHGGAAGTFCWADPNRQLVGIFFSQAGMPKAGATLKAVQKKLYEIVPAQR
ncbi:MAG TPA: serine hydrolase domain-containing protein [Gemmataceae bacterium]|nr:serine hydrolase domain-containing protein [Gemmataceae bacterium]